MHKLSLTSLLLLGVLAAASSVYASSLTAQAQTSWSTPVQVSDGPFTDWFPSIAAQNDGTVHIIWGCQLGLVRGSTEYAEDFLCYRELRNQTWSPINEIAKACTGGYTVRNSLALGYDKHLEALIRSCVNIGLINTRADDAWSARNWSPAAVIGESYYNELAIGGDGTIHAVFNEVGLDGPEQTNRSSEIQYRRSTDNGSTWSRRINVSRIQGAEERPQIAVDGNGRVHTVWDHGSDWYIGVYAPEYVVYSRSDDNGSSWQNQVKFGVAGESALQVSLGLSLEGNPLVVYRSGVNDNIYYQNSPDGGNTWSPPEQIPYVRARDARESQLDRYSMATDSANRIHLLMAGFVQESKSARPQLLHLIWDGQSWSQPEVVMAGINYPLWPKLVVAAGNQLHATWFTYSQLSDWGDTEIWYSNRMLNSPQIESSQPLISTPQPAPTDIHSLELNPSAPPKPITNYEVVTGASLDLPPPQEPSLNGISLDPFLGLLPAVVFLTIAVSLTLWWRGRGN